MVERKPTDITIASPGNPLVGIGREPRIWVPILVAVLAVAAFLIGRQYLHASNQGAIDATWERFGEVAKIDPNTFLIQGDSAELSSLANELSDSDAGAWARLAEISALIEAKDYQAASEALRQLREQHPDHALVTESFSFGDSRASIVENLEKFLQTELAWRGEHQELFAAPVPPPGARRVLLTTTLGDIEIAMLDEAPQTATTFLQLVDNGFFEGVSFHGIDKGFRIMTGDPHTKDPEKGFEFWGSGGRGHGVSGEANKLKMFKGVVATDLPLAPDEANTSRFAIVTADAHQYNGRCLVFGVVVNGMDVVETIANLPLASGTNRPQDPPRIELARIL